MPDTDGTGRGADDRGLIAWFARNPVAANLMMVAIILGGIAAAFMLRKEDFPSTVVQEIRIQIAYPGASPEEVESGVLVRIEEAVGNLKGIRQVVSDATQGSGSVRVTLSKGVDSADMTDKLKGAVDGIVGIPGDAEPAVISEARVETPVVHIQLANDFDLAALKGHADRIRRELLALPEVSSVVVEGAPPLEIAVEVPEATLREYGLTLAAVAEAIRLWSVDLPGGEIRGNDGRIRLRAAGQAYSAEDFAGIVLVTNADGTRTRLGDVASVTEGFEDAATYSYFDGRRSLGITVNAADGEDTLAIGEAVRRYVGAQNNTLPPPWRMTLWDDATVHLQARVDLMLKNAALGAVLVLVVLGAFLRAKVAAWVVLGMGVAFLGAFMFMPLAFVDVTVNTMSIFAFILVLGIVVDDAVVIAESAYAETQRHGHTLANVVRGARRVALPATFGVLTTITAFLPLLFLTGTIAGFAQAIGWVVVLCLAFSLVESKLILPSHLAGMRSPKEPARNVSVVLAGKLHSLVEAVYKPMLERAIAYRWTTLAIFVSVTILVVAMALGGWLRVVYLPQLQGDNLAARATVPEDAPEAVIADIVAHMNASLAAANDDIKAQFGLGQDIVEHHRAVVRDGRNAFFEVALNADATRVVPPHEVERRWREKTGDIAGAEDLAFSSGTNLGGAPVALRLSGRNHAQLRQAAAEVADHLRGIDGVFEVRNSAKDGPEEIRLAVRPEGEALGLTLAGLARQVREAFHGAEAQRIQRGDAEVRVMVRYPRSERGSISHLDDMWVRLPAGGETAFSTVAEYRLERGARSIRRIDGRRTITVSANVDPARVQPGAVMAELRRSVVPELEARLPEVMFGGGAYALEAEASFIEMIVGFCAAMIGVYMLLAIPLKSYLQPLVIMSVIPFGLLGAAIGHMVVPNAAGGFGIAMTAVSLLGFFAVAGVVVNDSLILVYAINRRLAAGASAVEAAVQAGAMRFRPIVLTSLTTFAGLVPICLERSYHAQLIVPMAVSLAFGVLFATFITLFLVPCLFVVQERLKATLPRWLRRY